MNNEIELDGETELAAEGRSRITLCGGVVAAVIAAAGLIASGATFFITLTYALDNNVLYARNDLIMAFMWVIFFIALMIAGCHLIRSGMTRRLMNIVPGVSLYFAGLALLVNAFYFFVHSNFAYAALAGIIGLGLIVAEWGSETI